MLHDKIPLKRKCGQITIAGIPTNVDFFSNYYNSILVYHNMAISPTKYASYLYCISKNLTYNVRDQKNGIRVSIVFNRHVFLSRNNARKQRLYNFDHLALRPMC